MQIPFYKYQGTGNDFIIIDHRTPFFDKENKALIAQMCHRKFGIGADGLILLENHPTHDFKMIYFNADGSPSTMCGNGGRCIVHFAHTLNIIKQNTTFEAIDGLHQAHITNNQIALKMNNVSSIQKTDNYYFLDTGSPHHVQMVKDLDQYNVYELGKEIRHNTYGASGANINFVEKLSENSFKVRTYERGVENETLSCGTGVTAVALAMHFAAQTSQTTLTLHTQGGTLQVSHNPTQNGYQNIWLQGPATMVFKGFWK